MFDVSPTYISTQNATHTHTKRYAAASSQLTFYILKIFTFLNLVILTRNYELPEDDLNNDRNMLECFECLNVNILD
jgi:hypothetical protein